jgi:hypothetical protein
VEFLNLRMRKKKALRRLHKRTPDIDVDID